jgi:hypothetical protein
MCTFSSVNFKLRWVCALVNLLFLEYVHVVVNGHLLNLSILKVVVRIYIYMHFLLSQQWEYYQNETLFQILQRWKNMVKVAHVNVVALRTLSFLCYFFAISYKKPPSPTHCKSFSEYQIRVKRTYIKVNRNSLLPEFSCAVASNHPKLKLQCGMMQSSCSSF